jgi:exonuclease VII large subunit
LVRGYTLTELNGKIIKSAEALNKGDKISIRFSDGKKEAEIL